MRSLLRLVLGMACTETHDGGPTSVEAQSWRELSPPLALAITNTYFPLAPARLKLTISVSKLKRKTCNHSH